MIEALARSHFRDERGGNPGGREEGREKFGGNTRVHDLKEVRFKG